MTGNNEGAQTPASAALAPTGAPPAGTPPAGAPPAGAPWEGAEGAYTVTVEGQEQPWWNGVQEAPIREYLTSQQFNTPDDAARAAWTNREGGVQLPSDKSTPEQWEAHYNALGRPEKAEGYDLKFADGVKVDEGFTNFGKQLFHDLGATPAAAQKAADKWNEYMGGLEGERIATERTANDAALTELTTKWGDEGKLEGMKAAGIRAVTALGFDAAKIESIEKHIGSAAIVELMATIGNAFPEGAFKGSDEGNSNPNDVTNMDATQAQARIDSLQANEEFMKSYTDKAHPTHKEALAEMEKLFAKASTKRG